MTLDYQRIKQWDFPDLVQSYDERDAILYALSMGMGVLPQRRALDFLYEGTAGGLRVLPTFPVVLGQPGFWMQHPDTGIDWVRVVHGEQRLTIHRPLPAHGTIVGRSRVLSIVDKGASTGAIVTMENTVSDAAGGGLYATMHHVAICRGNGGFGRNGVSSDESSLPSLAPTPDVPADATYDHATRPDTAMLYRLLADRNPLHIDPQVAAAAQYPRPILHGLATFGIATIAVLNAFTDLDPGRLESVDARFSSPIYPGETIRTEMWRDVQGVRFRCRVLERNVIALSHGRARLAV